MVRYSSVNVRVGIIVDIKPLAKSVSVVDYNDRYGGMIPFSEFSGYRGQDLTEFGLVRGAGVVFERYIIDSYKDDNWKFRNALVLDQSSMRRLAEFVVGYKQVDTDYWMIAPHPRGLRYRLCRLLVPALKF